MIGRFVRHPFDRETIIELPPFWETRAMLQHRWITASMHGRWCTTPDEALFDALRAGQASLYPGRNDEIVLKDIASVEAGQLLTDFGRYS